MLGRARRFRLERTQDVVRRVRELEPDHILITGDLTTTASDREFEDARAGLAGLLRAPERVSILPGNHDRYTGSADRSRRFERYFGAFMPAPGFPWLRRLDDRTGILGLDATRADLTARGLLPPDQWEEARRLLRGAESWLRRLVVACHYPLNAPPMYALELRPKRMVNAEAVLAQLAGVGPHLYCCGHVHVAWMHQPPHAPNQICLNSGAPLLADPHGFRPPGFLEIEFDDSGFRVRHHAWFKRNWVVRDWGGIDAFFSGQPLDLSGLGPLPKVDSDRERSGRGRGDGSDNGARQRGGSLQDSSK